MGRRVVLLGVLTALALPGVADAHKPGLSMARGKALIRRDAGLDHPSRVTLSHCKRESRRAVKCWVTEFGLRTVWADNGEPIVGDWSYEGYARI